MMPRAVTQDTINSTPQSCDSVCEVLLTREAPQRLSAQGFYWTLLPQAPSAQHVPRFQTLRRKAGIQHKPHCLYQQLRHSEPVLAFWEWRESSQNLNSDTNGQSCKLVFLRISSYTCCVNSFLGTFHIYVCLSLI